MCWKIAQHLLYLFHTCDIGVKVGELSNSFVASPTLQLILQPFRLFTYVTAHSTTLPLLTVSHALNSVTMGVNDPFFFILEISEDDLLVSKHVKKLIERKLIGLMIQ